MDVTEPGCLVAVRLVVKNTFLTLECDSQISRCFRRSKSVPPRMSSTACMTEEAAEEERSGGCYGGAGGDVECEKEETVEQPIKSRNHKRVERKKRRTQCIQENAALDEYIMLAAKEREGLSSYEICEGICGTGMPPYSCPKPNVRRPKGSGKLATASAAMIFRASCQNEIFLRVARGVGLTLPDIIALEVARIFRDRGTSVEIWTTNAVADHPWLKALLAEIACWQKVVGKTTFTIELPGNGGAVVFDWRRGLRVVRLLEFVCEFGGFPTHGASLEFRKTKMWEGTLGDHAVRPGVCLSLHLAPGLKAKQSAVE